VCEVCLCFVERTTPLCLFKHFLLDHERIPLSLQPLHICADVPWRARESECGTKKQRTDQSPLISWASEHGVDTNKFSGVAIRGSEESGVGFFASERLDAGRQVLFVLWS
jgi:hypothetical protein